MEEDIAGRLIVDFEDYAKSRGYGFGTGAGGDMRFRALQAAQTIIAAAGPGTTLASLEPMIRNAEVILRRFVDEMINAASEMEGYALRNPGVISEETFQAARSKLCPIWPVC